MSKSSRHPSGISSKRKTDSVASPKQTETNQNPTRRSIRWVVVIGAFVAALVGTFFLVKFLAPRPIPPELVGRWRIVSGGMKGTVVEFGADGVFRTMVEDNGEKRSIEARVQCRGNQLRYVYIDRETGEEQIKTQSIEVLDSKTLIVRDETAFKAKLVRVE